MSSDDIASIPETIQVAVRVRPLLQSEIQMGCHIVTEQRDPDEPQIYVHRCSEHFTFTHVFGPTSRQRDVYERCAKSLVKKLLDGFNVTVLAYGQTGSGKTYTMGTSFEGKYDDDKGIIPRMMIDLFDRITECDEFQYTVTCSFVELYQENLYDLLSYRNRFEKMVGIRQDVSGVVVPGLTEVPVGSADEALQWLIQGSSARAIALTSMNKESNRSHTIFTLTVRKIRHQQILTTSKLYLVDLAGSERSKKSHAVGDRFRESIQINKGLLALGNVISALGSTKNTKGFISYRDSKLTRLLQNSFGGNSLTLMIACVSPADYNVGETLSTLRYADRALRIRNKPVINEGEISAQDEIERLRLENRDLRKALGQEQYMGITTQKLEQQINSLKSELKEVSKKSNQLEIRASLAEDSLHEIDNLLSLSDESKLRKGMDEILNRFRKANLLWSKSNKV